MPYFEKSSPEEVGIPSGAIQKCLEQIRQKKIPLHSFLVLRQGKLAAEYYYDPLTADTLHRMFSITKSLTALAIGLLEEEGKLSLGDRIVTYFPEYVPADVHPRIAQMTIRDMLMMRTCHASTTYKLDLKSDWVESFFTVSPTHPAGTLFHYDTSSAHTLAALVVKLTGMDPLDYLRSRIPELELSEEAYLLKDPFGVPMGGSGLVAKPMDILKLGYLLLQKGLLQGRQCIPADFLKDATSKLSSTLPTAPLPSEACGYGYMIWIGEAGGPVLYGMGGQLVIVLSEYDMVVTTTADTQGIGGGNQVIYDAIYECLLPALSPTALAPNPAALRALEDLPKGLLPLEGQRTSPLAEQISGTTYRFEENRQGFAELTVTLTETEGSLDYTLQGQKMHLSFSLEPGTFASGSYPGYDMHYESDAAWITEDTLYIYFRILDSYMGSVRWEVHFGEGDVTLFLRKVEESLFGQYQGHLYGKSI